MKAFNLGWGKGSCRLSPPPCSCLRVAGVPRRRHPNVVTNNLQSTLRLKAYVVTMKCFDLIGAVMDNALLPWGTCPEVSRCGHENE